MTGSFCSSSSFSICQVQIGKIISFFLILTIKILFTKLQSKFIDNDKGIIKLQECGVSDNLTCLIEIGRRQKTTALEKVHRFT